ncbi:MAG: ribonuclease H-like domain-containing protein [Chloroflexota bacterium]|nr:ribonuclease H-like domain-containing protein [Chloroflexota bacterium]
MNDLFFDLETQKSIQEVGGRENIKLLRVSVAVTFSTAANAFKAYTEKEVPALIADLKAADRVVGFNLLNFDYTVLKFYTPERLSDLPTLDLLADIYNKLGFRIGLDALAAATLGVKKSGGGLEAIRWFREGKIDQLTAYCRDDVSITKQLFERGRDHGFVQYVDRDGRTKRVAVSWK